MRGRAAVLTVLIVTAVAGWRGEAGVVAQDDADATVAALRTELAEARSTAAARGDKINAQRTQLAGQRTQIAELRDLLPSRRSDGDVGDKGDYLCVADAPGIVARPEDFLGDLVLFCGTAVEVRAATTDEVLVAGDRAPVGYATLLTIDLDLPATDEAVRFIVGFDGDASAIVPGGSVGAWGTLVDRTTGADGAGAAVRLPLLQAQFWSLRSRALAALSVGGRLVMAVVRGLAR